MYHYLITNEKSNSVKTLKRKNQLTPNKAKKILNEYPSDYGLELSSQNYAMNGKIISI